MKLFPVLLMERLVTLEISKCTGLGMKLILCDVLYCEVLFMGGCLASVCICLRWGLLPSGCSQTRVSFREATCKPSETLKPLEGHLFQVGQSSLHYFCANCPDEHISPTDGPSETQQILYF